MAFPLIHPPKHFVPGSNPAEAWAEWKSAYLLYEEACEYSNKPPATRRALLLHVIGPEARNTVKTFNFASSTQETVDAIFAKFDERYSLYQNTTQAAALFNVMIQKEGQSIDDFVAQLKLQAQKCDFGQQCDRLVGDRIIVGIRDSALRERLFREKNLTLEKIVTACKAAEISKQHVTSLKAAATPRQDEIASHPQVVNYIRRSQGKQHPQQRQQTGYRPRFGNRATQQSNRNLPTEPQHKRPCSRCGTFHSPRHCPAYGKNCNACGKFGHFARYCRQGQQRHNNRQVGMLAQDYPSFEEEDYSLGTLHLDTEEPNNRDTDFSIGALTLQLEDESTSSGLHSEDTLTVDALSNSENGTWTEVVSVNGHDISFKLDTGSDVNILPRHLVSRMPLQPRLNTSTAKVSTYNGQPLKIDQECELQCTFNDVERVFRFLLVNDPLQPILGAAACLSLNLLRRVQKLDLTSGKARFDSVFRQFPDVFTGIGKLPGVYSIQLRDDAVPTVAAPRTVPKAIEQQVKQELNHMQQNGIIAKVTVPTDWVHPVVIIIKKNGSLRICLDPRNLNAAVRRPHYHIPVVEELFARLVNCNIFTLLDAKHAFWQLTLDEPSSYMCTFTTPWGRYRFLRVPFGLSVAPELFQQAIDTVFEGLPIVKPYFDDVLVASTNTEEHVEHLRAVLSIARTANLKFNKEKAQIGLSKISYLGHELSPGGISPDPEKVKAIRAVPVPADKPELLRFLGMATYLTKFIPKFSEKTSRLRELLKSNVAWVWTPQHTKDFNSIKQSLMSAPVLVFFDPTKDVVISTDASSFGLGSVLMQDSKPVSYASAALTTAQQQYAQIEKELLAVVFACERFHYYTFGRTVTVETDHKPLVAIQKKEFNRISPRLQRLLLRLQRYDVKLVYIPGRFLTVADALSRAPDKTSTISAYDDDPGPLICTLVSASPSKLTEIQEHTKRDPALIQVSRYIRQGWPDRLSNVHPEAKPYYQVRDELYLSQGCVCFNQRLVIPKACQSDVLQRLHMSHRGIALSKSVARQSIYWPGLSKDIEKMVMACEICQRHQKAHPHQPLLDRDIPDRPWQRIAMDFFHHNGLTYLLVIDCFSKFIEVKKMHTTAANDLTEALSDIYARFGAPSEVISDNGPPFDSFHFRNFNRQWDINHVTSSPHYPRANGQVERAVQTVKSHMTKTLEQGKDINVVLLDYRTTPINGMQTPAELLMGRRLKALLPAHPSTLKPHFSTKEHKRQLLQRQQQQHKYGDQHTKQLPPLRVNQPVWYWHVAPNDKTWKKAVVISLGQHPRSYIIQTESDRQLVRNRIHLRPRILTAGDESSRTPAQTSSTAEDYHSVIEHCEPSTAGSSRLPETGSRATLYQTRSGRCVKPPLRYEP